MGNDVKAADTCSSRIKIEPESERVTNRSCEEEWREARERIMLYLRLLNAPARMGLEIALEVLTIAQKEKIGSNRDNPVSSAMQALKRTLAHHGLFSSEGPDYGKWFSYGSGDQRYLDGLDLPEKLRSMPPINRGCMKPEDFE
ncbi:MAG: hypothetical protein ABIG67_04760 [Pseudomonadota bacterium]